MLKVCAWSGCGKTFRAHWQHSKCCSRSCAARVRPPSTPARPLADRLWEKVDRAGPVHPVLGTRCWIWTRGLTTSGYGSISTGNGRTSATSRVAWEVTNGPIPAGLFACHHCDNPPCCNPEHLFLGTHADNARDMAEKGRANAHLRRGEANGSRKHPERRPRGDRHWTQTSPSLVCRGERCHSAKLDAEKVREVRARSAMGERSGLIAAAFGIATSMVRRIVRRDNWKHVG